MVILALRVLTRTPFVKKYVTQVQEYGLLWAISRLFNQNVVQKALHFVDFDMYGIHTQPNCILTQNMVDFGQNQAYLNTI